MNAVRFPSGYHIEPLRRDHHRSAFRSGQAQVDDWLASKALQNQDKHLSATTVLVDPAGAIAGFYTLATAQVILPICRLTSSDACRAALYRLLS